MARISYEDSEKHYSSNSSEWFSLKNDGDIARVQFMLNSVEDIPIFSAHKVKVGDKERYVDCLRNPSDPIDMCPFCASGIPAKAVRFIVMYDHSDQKVKIWERGKQFISKLQGLMNRYNPLSDYVFEIERHGKPGDTSTKYEVYPMDNVDSYNMSEIDIPELEGSLILEKTFEDMEYYLDNNSNFPSNDTPTTSANTGRRTPASTEGVTRRSSAPAPQPTSRASRRASSGEEVF